MCALAPGGWWLCRAYKYLFGWWGGAVTPRERMVLGAEQGTGEGLGVLVMCESWPKHSCSCPDHALDFPFGEMANQSHPLFG